MVPDIHGQRNEHMNGTWSQVEIAGKPADVYEPPGPNRPRFAILYLHGYTLETLRGQDAYVSLFNELNLVCVCPHGRHSWWADRVCPEFDPRLTAERHVLHNVRPYIGERWDLPDRAVGLLGISMGGQGALRLAFKYPDLFPVVAAVSATVEYHEAYGRGSVLEEMYDSKEQCRQDTAPMHLQPSHFPPRLFFCSDPSDANWFRGNDRLDEKLSALGVPHEVDFTTRAGGHTWSYFNHLADRVVRFLHRGLEQEGRRLL
jgi:S-formylglutathione hydrolase